MSSLKPCLSLINSTTRSYVGECVYICVIYPDLPASRHGPGKSPAIPIEYENGYTPEGFRGFGEENNFNLSVTESLVLDCPARSLVSITTNLSCLTFHFEFRPRPFCVGFVMNKLSLVCCLFCQCFLYHGHNHRINVSFYPFVYSRCYITAGTDGVIK